MSLHLVIAAIWADQECQADVGELMRPFKATGTRGAVVTFEPHVVAAWDFQRTLTRLHLEELRTP